METKKSDRAQLESKRTLYFSIGLVLSVAAITLAFEWKSYELGPLVDLRSTESEVPEVQQVPITIQTPPPPPVVMPVIKEIPDEEEPAVDINFTFDIEVDEASVIDNPVPDNLPDETTEDEPFIFVEQQPAPEGGMQAFYRYVSQKINYPQQAVRQGVEGKVFVSFIVNTDGSLTDIQILKGIGAGCDEEALRVLKQAPRWKPGKQRGRAVRVRMQIPIAFSLQ